MFNNISSILKPNISPSFNGVQNITYTPLFHTNFKSNPIADSFTSDKFLDIPKEKIITISKSNPKIMNILKEFNIKLNPNIEELNKLKKGHLLNTRILVAKIYSNLPPNLKAEINLSELQQAAMLHDYGKVLIPKEILNKKNTLEPYEYQIVQQHAELGYELLKNQGLSQNVLDMIKFHHQNLKLEGYPKFEDNQNFNLGTQILSLADKYSALLENRCYKSNLSKEKCLEILQKEASDGLISQEIFDALKNSV